MAAPRPPRARAASRRQRKPDAQPASRLELLHELQVHQEEVHVQNLQLISAQQALEETRDRYVELYDFAPNGYLTLDPQGVIREINLTGCLLLGRQRERLLGLPLLGFIRSDRRGDFVDFLRKCRSDKGDGGSVVELEIRTADGIRQVQLLCKSRVHSSGRRELFVAVIDIGERKALERAREEAAAEHGKLVSRLLSVQEDERRRIARDIHDHLGQQLTGLRLKLELLGATAHGAALSRLVREAQHVAETLDASLDFFTGKL